MSADMGQGRGTADASSSQRQVFVSYSGEDRVIAEKVCRLLERDGLACWIAPRDVLPGHDFGEQIIDAIESTQVMVLILSTHANASIFVKKEVERAVSTGKVVIPLRIQNVQPSKALQLFVSSTQWIDAWTPPLAARVHLLAAAIHGLLGLPAIEEDDTTRPASSQPRSRSLWGSIGSLSPRLRSRPLPAVALLGLALVFAAGALFFSGALSGSKPSPAVSTGGPSLEAIATTTATPPETPSPTARGGATSSANPTPVGSLPPPGTVVAWGSWKGEAVVVPTDLSGVTAMAAGALHSLALRSGGTVVAWGDNTSGETNIPAGLSGVTAISAGGYDSLALKKDGTVVAWGDNRYGQTAVPAGLSGVTAIATGDYDSLALKSDGTVVAWGDNRYGQTNIPADLSGVTAISAGFSHSLALKKDGTVVAWGDNSYGQTAVPAGLSGISAISAGTYHSLALKKDGTVVAWGDNRYGQTAVPAGRLSGVTAIAAGPFYSLALKSDGTVVAWGDNLYGQTAVPAGLSGISAISAGGGFSLALVGSRK